MPVYEPLPYYLPVGYISLVPIFNHFTLRDYIEQRNVCVFSLIEAVFKQLRIDNLAKRKKRTNFYIRQFYHKATFELLSFIV